jgi:ketosteroid isomerase-like protein
MALDRLSDAHATFARLFNEKDLEGLVSLYEERAKLVLPQGDVVGREAIREAMLGFMQMKGTMRMEGINVIETDGVAVTSGSWQLIGENGQILMQGESVEVFRKGKDGRWLAAVDCPFGVG